MSTKPLKYFRQSQEFYRFIILKYIYGNGKLTLPVENTAPELENALAHIHLQSMIDNSLLQKNDQNELSLTEQGIQQLREHFIDYQLDLLILEQDLGDFFSNKINDLRDDNIKNVALYGASDTALSLLGHLQKSGINVSCIIDDNPAKQGHAFQGFPVVSHSELKNYPVDAIIIASVAFHREIEKNIATAFGQNYKVYTLLES
jgi:hypothetical protein